MSEEKDLKPDVIKPGSIPRPENIMRNFYSLFPSLAMLAGMQLDLFTPLNDGAMTAQELAVSLGIEEAKLEPLLYALVVAELIEVDQGKFANTQESARFLVRGQDDYIGEINGFFKSLLEMTLKTAESVGTGQPQAKFDFHKLSDEELLTYFGRQIHSSLSGGREIAEIIDFSKFTDLLDAGGGSGGVAMAICTRHPHLKATVADLPRVVGLAKHFIDQAGLSDRIGLSPTDLLQAPPQGEYDAAVLRAVIQVLSKDEAQTVLQHVGQALKPGGRIFIFGNVLEKSHLGPPAAIAFSLVFLNTYDQGRAYTEEEYFEMLSRAGFTDPAVDLDMTSDGMGLVSATKKP